MRARYYSPEMKRFINADIVSGAISNAITLNRFAYANGNPISHVDPFGTFTLDILDGDDDSFEDNDPGMAGGGGGGGHNTVNNNASKGSHSSNNSSRPGGRPSSSSTSNSNNVASASSSGGVSTVSGSAKASTSGNQNNQSLIQSTNTRYLRKKAVDNAWAIEWQSAMNGTPRSSWTPAQLQELIETKRVKGYEGHHIVSVSADPSLAGDPNNIRFYTRSEHFYQHFGDWRNPTYTIRP